jgi:hypothetical protein
MIGGARSYCYRQHAHTPAEIHRRWRLPLRSVADIHFPRLLGGSLANQSGGNLSISGEAEDKRCQGIFKARSLISQSKRSNENRFHIVRCYNVVNRGLNELRERFISEELRKRQPVKDDTRYIAIPASKINEVVEEGLHVINKHVPGEQQQSNKLCPPNSARVTRFVQEFGTR